MLLSLMQKTDGPRRASNVWGSVCFLCFLMSFFSCVCLVWSSGGALVGVPSDIVSVCLGWCCLGGVAPCNMRMLGVWLSGAVCGCLLVSEEFPRCSNV